MSAVHFAWLPPRPLRRFGGCSASAVARDVPAQAFVPATVTRVTRIGSGDRACVDTVRVLGKAEGILVGCFARGLFLVLSENEETAYAPTRPFRVNAGAVSNYVLLPASRTCYLSELRAGDAVLAVTHDGTGSDAAVALGRVKIERREMLLVEAEHDDGAFAVVLQAVETCRLATPSGPVDVTTLKGGEVVLVALLEVASRHVGLPSSEPAVEQ